MKQTKWTEQRINKMKKLYSNGLSYKEIAKEMGMPRGSVGSTLKRLGISRKRKQNKVAKRSAQESIKKNDKGMVQIELNFEELFHSLSETERQKVALEMLKMKLNKGERVEEGDTIISGDEIDNYKLFS